jgi:hypothetical protein
MDGDTFSHGEDGDEDISELETKKVQHKKLLKVHSNIQGWLESACVQVFV